MTLNEAKRLLKKNGYLLEATDEDSREEYDEQQKSVYRFLHNECGLEWEPKNTDKSYLDWGFTIIYVTKLNDDTPIRVIIDPDGWVDAVRVGDEKTITANEFIKRCKH